MNIRTMLGATLSMAMLLICSLEVCAATYTYDELNRLKTVTYSTGQVINYNYDAGGNITLGKGGQSISFGIAPSVVVGGTGTVNATGGASLNAVTFSTTTPTVCTISGSTVTGVTAGNCTIAANQAGNTNYSAAPQVTQNIIVGKGSSVITWAPPATITYGTALSAAQLNATASVPGSFVYTPAAGSVQPVGTQTLSVTFTPADTANYNTATGNAPVTVAKAILAVTANDANKTYGSANPALTVSYSGFVNGDTITSLTTQAVATTTAVTGSPAGNYAIIANGGVSANYSFNYVAGTLTVAKAPTTITWSNPADITYGTQLSGAQLNATGSVPGTMAYTPIAGTLLDAGASKILSAVFTPSDQTNYSTSSKNVNIKVVQAPQVITFNPLAAKTYGDSPVILSASGGASGTPVTFSIVSGPGSLGGTNNNTLTINGAGTIVISANQAGTGNYTTATPVNRSLTVNKAPLIVAANPVSRVYGMANPTFTSGYNGFVNNENFLTSGISGAPLLTTTATTSSPLGNYAITAAIGSLSSTKYQFSFIDGTLNINPASASVQLSSLSQFYNDTPRPVTVTTTPPGLPVNITYNNLNTVPTEAGSYNVIATVNDVNYDGIATGTLLISLPKLSVTVHGNGGGSVNSDPAGIACSGGTCSNSFSAPTVTLIATPAAVSLFSGWTGCTTSFETTCNVIMGNNRSVTATFTPSLKAMIGTAKYDSLNAAYTAAGVNANILLLDTVLTEDFSVTGKNIILTGGYSKDFITKSGVPTVLEGTLVINSGSLQVDGLTVR